MVEVFIQKIKHPIYSYVMIKFTRYIYLMPLMRFCRIIVAKMSGSGVPPAPNDPEQRNIIDKLAQFVARNGPDFEMTTKNRQKGNPKFQFLFGGEHYSYYMYKVNAEQAAVRQQYAQQQPPSQQGA